MEDSMENYDVLYIADTYGVYTDEYTGVNRVDNPYTRIGVVGLGDSEL
jgi:hypothetical protein